MVAALEDGTGAVVHAVGSTRYARADGFHPGRQRTAPRSFHDQVDVGALQRVVGDPKAPALCRFAERALELGDEAPVPERRNVVSHAQRHMNRAAPGNRFIAPNVVNDPASPFGRASGPHAVDLRALSSTAGRPARAVGVFWSGAPSKCPHIAGGLQHGEAPLWAAGGLAPSRFFERGEGEGPAEQGWDRPETAASFGPVRSEISGRTRGPARRRRKPPEWAAPLSEAALPEASVLFQKFPVYRAGCSCHPPRTEGASAGR